MKTISREEYEKLEAYAKELVKHDPDAARAEVSSLLLLCDRQFTLYICLLSILFAGGLWMIVFNFSDGRIVFSGILIVALASVALLSAFGKLSHPDAPPFHEDIIGRDDFPKLFAAFDDVAARNQLPQIGNVSFENGRHMTFQPMASHGRRPEWRLCIGFNFFLEISESEFLGHFERIFLEFHHSDWKLYRDVYEAMFLRSNALGLNQYWRAWALVDAFAAVQKYENEWSGTMQYRFFIGAVQADPIFTKCVAKLTQEGWDMLRVLREYSGSGVMKLPVQEELIQKFSRDGASPNARRCFESTFDFDNESQRFERMMAIGQWIEQFEGEPAFSTLILGEEKSEQAFLELFSKSQDVWPRQLQLGGDLARSRLQALDVNKDRWTADDYAAVALFELGESGEVNARHTLEAGLVQFPGHPWLLVQLMTIEMVMDFETTPEIVKRYSQYPVLERLSKERLAIWSWYFGEIPDELSLDSKVEFRIGTQVLAAEMPCFYREAWIELLQRIPEIGRAFVFRKVDHIGKERIRLVAEMKSQSWKLRPEWYLASVKKKLPLTEFMEVELVTSDNSWLKGLLRKNSAAVDRLF